MKTVSVNQERRLYNVPCGDGWTCLGFDVAHDRCIEAARIVGDNSLVPSAIIGTPEHYEQATVNLRRAMATDAWKREPLHFDLRTPEAVRRVLREACGTDRRLRLFYGDPGTGEAWADENDVIGTIGRSMGPMKAALLIENRRSHGGGAILDGSIVAIKSSPSTFLYRHPTFSVGDWAEVEPGLDGYLSAASHNGDLVARFRKADGATKYIAFMKGERFSK